MALLPANQPYLFLADHHLGPARQPDVQGTPHVGVPGEPGKGFVLRLGQLHLTVPVPSTELLLARSNVGVAPPYDTIMMVIIPRVNGKLRGYVGIVVLNAN